MAGPGIHLTPFLQPRTKPYGYHSIHDPTVDRVGAPMSRQWTTDAERSRYWDEQLAVMRARAGPDQSASAKAARAYLERKRIEENNP